MRCRASLAVAVVLPEPCGRAMRITVGGRGENEIPPAAPPMSLVSSSLTILTTVWPGLSAPTTSSPSARSFSCLVNSRTTRKLTSASSSARRISRIVALTSSSVRVPRWRTSASVCWSFSERASNTPDERNAVAHGQDHLDRAWVVTDMLVEAGDALVALVAQRVAGDDQAALRQLGQDLLVVLDVVVLPRVDED